jgi:hypothetical protein
MTKQHARLLPLALFALSGWLLTTTVLRADPASDCDTLAGAGVTADHIDVASAKAACSAAINAGSYPGYIFTDGPLDLASGHYGLGHGSGAHAPDEYFVIESTNPAVRGWDGAVLSYVEYLYELAK